MWAVRSDSEKRSGEIKIKREGRLLLPRLRRCHGLPLLFLPRRRLNHLESVPCVPRSAARRRRRMPHGQIRGRSPARHRSPADLRRRGRDSEVARAAEVGLRLGAAEAARGLVVGPRRLLSRVEGAQPLAGLLPRVPDLRREPAPRPLPHAPEVRFPPSSSSLRRRRHRQKTSTKKTLRRSEGGRAAYL
ncbi:unnamed protein product [Musa acuminata subsp. malaccensis]|uniref:(wild Malaysian banana) hypothetical protein n=1 Tax=Musa acuminata subsp. malaccensis TaxID=214687 RepID=A0A8D7AR74_MUSAM|nr:unnamed protein product [Musa acuminata subsp. malaccensis]